MQVNQSQHAGETRCHMNQNPSMSEAMSVVSEVGRHVFHRLRPLGVGGEA